MGLETDLRIGAGAVGIETSSLLSWRLSRPRGQTDPEEVGLCPLPD